MKHSMSSGFESREPVDERRSSIAQGIKPGCVVLLLLACGTLGCQPSVDPAVMRQREKYLLSVEPSGAIGVVEAREKMAEEQETEVVLIGRVGANVPSNGTALFVVRDPAATGDEHHGHEDGHDPDNCPFCKAEKEGAVDTTAWVQVVDDAGEVVNIDARKLLPIKEHQLVVVRGIAQLDSLGNLVVSANGVYVRR